MKLSDAISLGATLRPQGTGVYYRKEGDETCAAGAALEAAGVSVTTSTAGVLAKQFELLWPWAAEERKECPVEGCRDSAFVAGPLGLITHLNDLPHYWTRERIAAWVATVEPPDEQPCETEATTAQSVLVEAAG